MIVCIPPQDAQGVESSCSDTLEICLWVARRIARYRDVVQVRDESGVVILQVTGGN